MKNLNYAKIVVGLLIVFFCFEMFSWTVNRVYVPEGKSLQVRYKGPLPAVQFFASRQQAKAGYFAEEGEVGVLSKMYGPGRHFFCPLWYETTLVDDIFIKPGEVGIVTCNLGDALPDGEFLVDGELGETKQKGILRKALAPGWYRINPYAYTVKVVTTEVNKDNNEKISGWVRVPTGYVGVVTNLASNPLTKQSAGIQDSVMPPGIYPINGREQQVDIIFVGYTETSLSVTDKKDPATNVAIIDEGGETVVENGINFPSSDGFAIHLDYTLIWGLMPDQCANAIKTFGNMKQVENKVVLPQIESICRNHGSEYSAVNLLVGEKREVYQNDVLKELHTALDDKEISLLYGLVRHIYIPQEVRKPIQMSFVADELTLTRTQEQETTKTEGSLRESEKMVILATEKVGVDTTRQYQANVAKGTKTAATTAATTLKLIAAIDRQTAELDAQALTVKGEAESKGKQLIEEAKSNKFKLAVGAFGTAEAFNNWVFASGLPADLDLKMFYAGPGTLWTDLKNPSVMITPPAAIPAATATK
jgi:regulator of protease activity HflC (stomatin/prohibitin superfamily)